MSLAAPRAYARRVVGAVRRSSGGLEGDAHRARVGGLWEEMGEKQLAFLVEQGLRRDDYLLDVGCGSLRGGVRFVDYLEPGHYFGLDIDGTLLEAGKRELAAVGLGGKAVTLLEDDAFRFGRFGRTFDVAIAQSVFTHLPFNAILRCLAEIERALRPGGRFFATFFRAPGARLDTEPHPVVAGVTTSCDADPYHYDPDIFAWAVEGSALACSCLGDWGHPRKQEMLLFTKR